MRRFPTGKWGRQTLQFYPAPYRAPMRAFAVLVFAWQEELVLVCDIAGRGWCVPSGRVEPSETSMEAGLRETLEEGGAELADCQYIGCYKITDRDQIRWADCFVGRVTSLGDIGCPEESSGRRLLTREELPSSYHIWDSLIERVFEHSREVFERIPTVDN